jgi:hypothetical protein
MTIRDRYLYLAFAAFGSVFVGIALGSPWLLPLLNAAFAWPLFVENVRRERRVEALQEMCFWALAMTFAVVLATYAFPDLTGRAVFRGRTYMEEMFAWIRTGAGAEGTPSVFVPMHLRHLALFMALSLVSAGFLGLVMGAVLLNYMNFYVGSLYAHATDPLAVALFGWPVWSILRVIGYVALAIPLAEITLALFTRRPLHRPGLVVFGLVALALLAADLLLKAALAPAWRTVLDAATDL